MNLDDIKKLAKKMHSGQKDKAGVAYFKHIETVAKRVKSRGLEYEMVGYLHDIIEDTKMTAKELLKLGVPVDVVDAVVAMTKIKGEDYNVYLKRVSSNKLAKVVKAVDLEHNSDLSRLPEPSEKDIKRTQKYKMAISKLKECDMSDKVKALLEDLEAGVLTEGEGDIDTRISDLDPEEYTMFMAEIEKVVEVTTSL